MKTDIEIWKASATMRRNLSSSYYKGALADEELY